MRRTARGFSSPRGHTRQDSGPIGTRSPARDQMVSCVSFRACEIAVAESEAVASAALDEGALRTPETLAEGCQRDRLPAFLDLAEPLQHPQLSSGSARFAGASPGQQSPGIASEPSAEPGLVVEDYVFPRDQVEEFLRQGMPPFSRFLVPRLVPRHEAD